MLSAEWHTASSPRPKTSRLVKSKEKVMLVAFFDIDGVVHHEFSPPGQTVNGHFCVQVLQRLRDTVRRKRCDKWQGEWCVCITITHRATHRLFWSSSSPRKAFLSSPNHRTLRISLRVTFGCSLLWKWASRGHVSQPWGTPDRMWWPNSGRFQKKTSAGASNDGRINGASVCVRKGSTLKVTR